MPKQPGVEHVTAFQFIEAIYHDEPVVFWSLLSTEAHSFLKGLWYGKKLYEFTRLRDLSRDDFFVEPQVRAIMKTVRGIWGDDLPQNAGTAERLIVQDAMHATVKLVVGMGSRPVVFIRPTSVEAILIPLVLEVQPQDGGGFMGMWKIDYMKMIEG